MVIRGVDVSKYQGIILPETYRQLNDFGYKFCIIKMGGNNSGYYEDRMFATHYKNAKGGGMEVGAYYYLASDFNVQETLLHILQLLKDNHYPKFSYPFFLDVEETGKITKSERTKKVKMLLNCLEELGYFVGIYGSEDSTFKNLLVYNSIQRYCLWVAKWGNKQPGIQWGIWQNAGGANIPQVNALPKIDTNNSNCDYAKLIKGEHFNGY